MMLAEIDTVSEVPAKVTEKAELGYGLGQGCAVTRVCSISFEPLTS